MYLTVPEEPLPVIAGFVTVGLFKVWVIIVCAHGEVQLENPVIAAPDNKLAVQVNVTPEEVVLINELRSMLVVSPLHNDIIVGVPTGTSLTITGKVNEFPHPKEFA